MQINSINNLSIQNKTQGVNFKSTYPVVHWVAEANSSYAPVANLDIVKKLQGKIVRVLNKPLSEITKPLNIAEQKLRAYVGASDIDYRNLPKVRSFYNRFSGSVDKYSPVSYVISGANVDDFETYLAKGIGKAKHNAKELLNNPYSPETVEAIKLYNRKGLDYVNDYRNSIKDDKGMRYILHTKFEIVRNKLGKIKDYRLVDARFLPAQGKGNPLEKLYR